MKKIILFFFSSIILTSCSDFLDLNPISSPNENNFYGNETDFNNAILGAYSTLSAKGVFQEDIQLVGDIRSDNTEMGTTASNRFDYYNMQRFEMQTSSEISQSIWTNNYSGILRSNKIIDEIENLDASDSFKDRIRSEAQFLRAIFYFNLVRVFGDVPLFTSVFESVQDAYEVGRISDEKVYEQIIKDLDEAAINLPENVGDELGRATKGAALSLLGKVLLTVHNYDSAKVVLQEVIDLNQYKLLDNYADLWDVQKKNNEEIIFAVQFQRNSTAGTGSNFCERFTPYLYPYLGFYSTNGGYNIPTEDLIDAYETGDLRKNASLKESYEDSDGNLVTGLQGRFCTKFFDLPVQGEGSNDNWPVMRYADVLLMYAECVNEEGFDSNPDGLAFKYLNEIRHRASLPNKTSGNSNPALSVNNQEEFREALLHERRVEFAFEGQRWFDLIRFEKAVEIMSDFLGKTINQDKLLLPIPLGEIEINPDKIKQNPGY